MEFITGLFDTSDFPARWRCGHWTLAHGWLHILSDVGVWAAYFAIPLVLGYFVARRSDLPFRRVFLLFVAFILLCGTTHLMEAVIFWWPAYRLAGALKLLTAVVSWVTVLALVRVAPAVLVMRTPEELERVVAARTDAERRLKEANVELERRVEERTADLGRSVVAVAEEKERLRTTLASIGDAVISTDRDGHVTYLNPVAEALTGWTNAEAAGVPLTRVFQIVNEDTRLPVENPALRALTEGVIVGLANHTVLIGKDGRERPIDDSAAPIRCKDGEIVGGVLVFRDISERHRAETAQREVQQQLATTLESITDGFLRIDREWQVVYVNAEAERLNQRPRSETLGRTVWELFPAIVGTRVEAEYRRCVAEQVTVEFENLYEPWGRWYGLKCFPTPGGGLTVYIRDITEQKVHQGALAASEARFRELADAMPQIVYVTDAGGRIEFVNRQWLDYTGQTAAQTVDFAPVVHPDDLADLLRRWERSAATGTPLQSEFRLRRAADGEYRWFLTRSVPVRDAGGHIRAWYGTSTDIHDQKRAEQEIARLAADSERQRRLYETVLTNTPDFVYVFSLDHKVVYANDALIRMWGRGHDGAIGKTFLEIGYEPWHAEMHDREIDTVRATKQPVRGEVPFDGTHGRREYDYIFVPVIGADGEVEAVAGTTRDVTERKETERQLRDGREQLDFALAAADLGQWSLNLADHTAHRTLRHDQLFGYDTLLPEWTYEMFLEHVVPDDRAAVDADFQKSVATGSAWAVECRIRRADGAVRHIWTKALVRRDAGGHVERMLGIVGDITDRRQVEERHAFLVRLADTLRPLSDPVDVQAEASRVLVERLGGNRAVYFEVRGDDYVVERDYTDAAPSLVGRYPIASFGPDQLALYRAGRTVFEADVTDHHTRSPDEKEVFAAVQIRSYVGVPLVKGGVFVAGLAVHAARVRTWTPTEIAIIEETAERTWAAVERVRAEAALRQSEERRRLALDAAELGAWHIDPATNAITTDERFRVIFAGTTEPMDYEQAFAAVHPDDRGRIREAVAAAIRSDDPAPYAQEYRVVHPDGSVRWVFAKGRANYDREGPGRLVSFDGTVADVTARKRIEEERERLVGQLRDQDRRKDEFLATLAHELRNPLAPIRNGLEVIRMAGANGTIEQARSMMERQLGQMVRLVDDLLDVSRVTTGKLTLSTDRLELRAVIDAALETSRPVIEQAGHDLSVVIPDEPIFVDGDLTRLAQVVSNLLTNSAKYTHRGGHIRVAVGRADGTAVVSVTDDGIGIPPAMLGRVFEMFVQVDRTLEKTTGGLGIGLSLVKGLVEMHGGTIEARSAGEGRGSEFEVRLPVAMPAAGGPGAANGRAEEVVTSSLRRILVVDDNVDSADSLGQLLEMLGNEVRTAYDGEAGIRVAAEFRPAVVLCDIGMPKVNGYAAARRIRAEPWGKNVVLVALTGWGQEDDRQKSADAGFDFHLVKPVEAAALMKLLAGLKNAPP